MTRLVQISDLHFGREDPELLGPLAEAIDLADPDLLVMAGDFVQRARDSQFREAAAFMQRLGRPWLGVPGNHDIPLFNIFLRLFAPYRPYRKWIAEDPAPTVELGSVTVIGLDTTDPLAHQRGRVDRADIRRIGTAIAESGDRLPVIAAHHPFHHSPDIEKKLMVGASAALEHWADCGPHIILSGHLHRWLVEPFARRIGPRMTLQVHCGTGLSLRLRGQPNDFAILDCDTGGVTVTRMVATERRFRAAGEVHYDVTADGWERRGPRVER